MSESDIRQGEFLREKAEVGWWRTVSSTAAKKVEIELDDTRDNKASASDCDFAKKAGQQRGPLTAEQNSPRAKEKSFHFLDD
jgi:hypothetical protein